MATYNRAHTIERAVSSVLNQTYNNIELIIIDDGSTDSTLELLKKINSPVIRIKPLGENKGVTAAKNSGLEMIKGEWFTILDSDDEITEDAISSMMEVPLMLDETVTAVTCNCLDTSTGEMSGRGLGKNQYLDIQTLMTVCEGEFWGITSSSLLQKDRFNEKLRGFECTLWYKIDNRAKRYYVHKPLRIYHTEGDDRIMKSKFDFSKDVRMYENLVYEKEYLMMLKEYRPVEFFHLCKNGILTLIAAGKKNLALKYHELLGQENKSLLIKLSFRFRGISQLVKMYRMFKFYVKR